VLVGNRQNGRETADHVTRVAANNEEIVAAINSQLAHPPYGPSTLYGDGKVSQRIAESLARLTPYVQKRLAYVLQEGPAAGADQP
jgi:hypothetical protein